MVPSKVLEFRNSLKNFCTIMIGIMDKDEVLELLSALDSSKSVSSILSLIIKLFEIDVVGTLSEGHESGILGVKHHECWNWWDGDIGCLRRCSTSSS